MTTTATIEVAALDGGVVRLNQEQLSELDSQVEGRVLRPRDEGWDDADSDLERRGACSATSTGPRRSTGWRPCSVSFPRPVSPA